jgi:hypothetical protein
MTEEKTLKPQPTRMPETVREYYTVIAHPDPYQDEPDDSFLERQQLLAAFNTELTREGLTIDDLAMAELGLKPNNANPLLASLIARI